MDQRRQRRTDFDPPDWMPGRRPVAMAAFVQERGSCAFAIRVTDLSVSGCHLWAGFRLTPGRPARLHVAGFAPFRGTIAWAKDWQAGMHFDRMLHPAVLAHLVARHPVLLDSPAQLPPNASDA